LGEIATPLHISIKFPFSEFLPTETADVFVKAEKGEERITEIKNKFNT